MRKYLFLYSLIFLTFSFYSNVYSQTKAITELGDTIYVYNNGTWSFELLEETPVVENFQIPQIKLDIDTVDTKYLIPRNSKKEVKNRKGLFSIKYNDQIWKRIPVATLNEEAEFAFEHKESDLWCVLISEDTPIQVANLFLIAKSNMEKTIEAEAEIVKLEVKNVNGTEILNGVLKARYTGINFIFDSYYFSNDKGSVQFTIWTSETLWSKYKDDIDNLHNGFIVSDLETYE